LRLLQYLLLIPIVGGGALGVLIFLHLLPETAVAITVLPPWLSALLPSLDSPRMYGLITVMVLTIVLAAVMMGVIEKALTRKEP
jgi:hypothetical protein